MPMKPSYQLVLLLLSVILLAYPYYCLIETNDKKGCVIVGLLFIFATDKVIHSFMQSKKL